MKMVAATGDHVVGDVSVSDGIKRDPNGVYRFLRSRYFNELRHSIELV